MGNASADKLTDLVQQLRDQADGGPVTVADVVDATGSRALGPLLFFPALLAMSPVGAIPGVPAVFAAVIILVAGQSLVSRNHLWLPDVIGKRELSADKLKRFLDKSEAVARRVDRILGNHLTFLVQQPAPKIVAALCILLALTMIPLELVPFAVAVPAGAILLFSIGLVTNDGVVIAVGLTAAAAAFGWTISLL